MEAGKPGLVTWIESHLWAILAAGFAAYGGYVTGMTTTSHRLDLVEQHAADAAAALKRVERSQAAVTRNLDRINDKLGIEPPQPLEMDE